MGIDSFKRKSEQDAVQGILEYHHQKEKVKLNREYIIKQWIQVNPEYGEWQVCGPFNKAVAYSLAEELKPYYENVEVIYIGENNV